MNMVDPFQVIQSGNHIIQTTNEECFDANGLLRTMGDVGEVTCHGRSMPSFISCQQLLWQTRLEHGLLVTARANLSILSTRPISMARLLCTDDTKLYSISTETPLINPASPREAPPGENVMV